MRWLVTALTLTALFTMSSSTTAEDKKPNARVYEMRLYYAQPGKLDDLNARFKNHTLKFFEKHGMTNVGYFVPVGENKDEKLVYFLSYPSKEAAEKFQDSLFFPLKSSAAELMQKRRPVGRGPSGNTCPR